MKKLMLAIVPSIIVAILAVVCFWFYFMFKAEFGLVKALENALGGTISYTKVDWVVNSSSLRFNVEGVKIKMSSTYGTDMVYNVGNIKVDQDYFGAYQLTVKLPKEQEVLIKRGNIIVADHKINMEGGSFVYFNKTNRFNFSADKVSLLKKQDFIIEGLLFDNTVSNENLQAWKFAINKIGYNNKFVTNLLIDLRFDQYPAMTGQNILPSLLSGNINEINSLFKNITKAAAANNGVIHVNNLNFKVDDKTFGLSGAFEINKDNLPEGSVMVSTNSLESVVNYGLNRKMLSKNWLVGNDLLRKVLITSNRDGNVNIKVGSNDGVISVEGMKAGRSIELQNLLYW